MRRMHGETAEAYAQRRAFAAAQKDFQYVPGPDILIPILCTCLSWHYPHELSAHKKLKSDYEWPTPEVRESRERNWHEYDTSLR